VSWKRESMPPQRRARSTEMRLRIGVLILYPNQSRGLHNVRDRSFCWKRGSALVGGYILLSTIVVSTGILRTNVEWKLS